MRILSILLLLLLGVCSCKSSVDTQTLRFKMIADAQQYSNGQILNEANNVLQRLAADVDKNRNMPKDEAVLKQAQDILAYTKATATQLHVVREAIISRLGSTNQLERLANKEIVNQVLFQSNASTSISSVHHQLRVYATYMKPLVPQLPESLGSVPEATHRETSSGERNNPNSYADFYFEGTTAAEALAVLAQQEAEVLHLGLEAIKQQSNKVGVIADVFNRVGAYAVAESKVVRPGEKYKADLMLVASYNGIRPLQMTVNGSEIAIKAERGQVEFEVPTELPSGQNSVEAFWDGTISFREYDGHDTVFRVRVPYTIRK